MKKLPSAIKLFLLLFLSLIVAIVYGVRGVYEARAHRAACYRANLEELNSLEPSTATINAEIQEIQLDVEILFAAGLKKFDKAHEDLRRIRHAVVLRHGTQFRS